MPTYDEEDVTTIPPPRTRGQKVAAGFAAFLQGVSQGAGGGGDKRKALLEMEALRHKFDIDKMNKEYALREKLYASQDRAGHALALARDKQQFELTRDEKKAAAAAALAAQRDEAASGRVEQRNNAGYRMLGAREEGLNARLGDTLGVRREGMGLQDAQFYTGLQSREGMNAFNQDQQNRRLDMNIGAQSDRQLTGIDAAATQKLRDIQAAKDLETLRQGGRVQLQGADLKAKANANRFREQNQNFRQLAIPGAPPDTEADYNGSADDGFGDVGEPHPAFKAMADHDLSQALLTKKEIADVQRDPTIPEQAKPALIESLTQKMQGHFTDHNSNMLQGQVYAQPLGTRSKMKPTGDQPETREQYLKRYDGTYKRLMKKDVKGGVIIEVLPSHEEVLKAMQLEDEGFSARQPKAPIPAPRPNWSNTNSSGRGAERMLSDRQLQDVQTEQPFDLPQPDQSFDNWNPGGDAVLPVPADVPMEPDPNADVSGGRFEVAFQPDPNVPAPVTTSQQPTPTMPMGRVPPPVTQPRRKMGNIVSGMPPAPPALVIPPASVAPLQPMTPAVPPLTAMAKIEVQPVDGGVPAFIYNGVAYSMAQMQAGANKRGLSLEQYIEMCKKRGFQGVE